MFSTFQTAMAPGHNAGFQQGLYKRVYSGYFNGDPTWFVGATKTATVKVPGSVSSSIPTTTTNEIVGWFKAPYSENFTFTASTDDKGLFWFGTNALSGNFNAGNAAITTTVSTGTSVVSLIAGNFYAFRYQAGNNAGPGFMTLAVSSSHLGSTQNLAGLSFFNPNTQGI
jgi:hypothetical protein